MNKLIVFSASWCGPCKRLAPAVAELMEKYPDNIVKYDVDVEVELREDFEITAVPTLILVDDDGQEISRKLGILDKDSLESFLLG